MKHFILLFIPILFCFCACSVEKCDNCIYKNDDAKFSYNAIHIDIETSDSTFYSVVLKSGKSFFLFQNKLQYEVLKFESSQKLSSNYKSESTTGFKESQDEIWLHPPRTDKFKRITQLAPYPQISRPPKVGKTYEGSINMVNNWGDWSGKSTSYKLIIDSIYHDLTIDGEAVALSGCGFIGSDTCCVKYSYSDVYGFYKWDYSWGESQKFIMTLIK